MGLSRSPRTRASVLFLILVVAAISGARANRVMARQEPAPAQRWDGLIELISGHYDGRHKVTATYLGDPNYKGSTALVTQTVN